MPEYPHRILSLDENPRPYEGEVWRLTVGTQYSEKQAASNVLALTHDDLRALRDLINEKLDEPTGELSN